MPPRRRFRSASLDERSLQVLKKRLCVMPMGILHRPVEGRNGEIPRQPIATRIRGPVQPSPKSSQNNRLVYLRAHTSPRKAEPFGRVHAPEASFHERTILRSLLLPKQSGG